MSLDWDATAIPEETRTVVNADGERELSPVTHALIWATIPVGIGEITEREVPEFYARLYAYERATGSMLVEYGEDGARRDRWITEAEVRAHVGLRTNAFPRKSDVAFAKDLMRIVRERLDRERRHEARVSGSETVA